MPTPSQPANATGSNSLQPTPQKQQQESSPTQHKQPLQQQNSVASNSSYTHQQQQQPPPPQTQQSSPPTPSSQNHTYQYNQGFVQVLNEYQGGKNQQFEDNQAQYYQQQQNLQRTNADCFITRHMSLAKFVAYSFEFYSIFRRTERSPNKSSKPIETSQKVQRTYYLQRVLVLHRIPLNHT